MLACPHCGGTHEEGATRCPVTHLPLGPEAGLVGGFVAGRYRLVRLLGDGGMGAVYKAADQVLRRFVAIKLLHPQVAANKTHVERFEREARAAAAIGHPNIIEILDFGETKGAPYMVMEYLRGRSVVEALMQDGPLPVARACAIATHALAGLAAAHDRGILHRDLKPANLMLIARYGDKDFVKVCDFGFAALLAPDEQADPSLTPVRTLVGTPAYAAPERLRGDHRRDARLDIWSMGIVLYEMLCGQRPFDGASVAELARRIKTEPPPSLRARAPEVPEALERVIFRALAKSPEERWGSAAELSMALVPFGGKHFFEDDEPSDSFTMDLVKIRAREQQRVARSAEDVLAELTRPVAHTVELKSEDLADIPTISLPDRGFAGSIMLALRRFVATRFGEPAELALVASLAPPLRAHIDRPIAPTDWVEYNAVRAYLETLDRVHGSGELQLVVDAGRAVGDSSLSLFAELAAAKPPPELVLAEVPNIARHVVRGVGYHVRRVGRGYGRIELDEGEAPPSITGCVCTLGFLERVLVAFGAKDVEISLTSCRALGDPRNLLDLSWLS